MDLYWKANEVLTCKDPDIFLRDLLGGAMFVSDPKKPVGGHVMAHASTIRLSVRKGKGEQRLVKVVQAPHLPEGEASYAIQDTGIVDYKD